MRKRPCVQQGNTSGAIVSVRSVVSVSSALGMDPAAATKEPLGGSLAGESGVV